MGLKFCTSRSGEGVQNIQISTYRADSSGQGGHYDWHADASLLANAQAIRRRVLSASVQLTDPSEYATALLIPG